MRYLLMIYLEPGYLSPGDEVARAMNEEYRGYSGWLVENGMLLGGEALQPVTNATSVAVRDGRRIVTDGPFAETKEHLGGLLPDRGRRPRRRDRRGRPDPGGADRDDRGPADPGAHLSGDAPRGDRARRRRPSALPRGARPGARDADPRPGRLRPRGGSGRRRLRRRPRALAGRRVPDNPGAWITTTARNRAIDRVRRARRFADKAAVIARDAAFDADRAAQRDAHGGGGRDVTDPRRPAATDLHLLPPGARAGVGDRADAAHARRPDHARDRPRLPRARADPRPAPRPRQEEDPRGGHPLRGARPATASPTASIPCCASCTSCSTRATTPRRARR